MAPTKEILGIYARLSKLTGNESLLRLIPQGKEKIERALETKRMSVDRMKPLIEYTLGIVTYKPYKIFIFLMVCVHFFGMSLTIYTLLKNFEKQAFFEYGAFCGLHTVVWLSLLTLVLIKDRWINFLLNYGRAGFPIEIMDDEKQKKVFFTMNILKLTAAIDILFSILTPIGFLMVFDYVNRKTYFCVWIQEYSPKHAEIIMSLYNFTHLPSGFAFISGVVCFSYGCFTALYQIYVLRCMIADIPRSCIPKKFRRDSKLYQEVLRQKMIMVIETHQFIVGYQTRFSDLLNMPVFATYVVILVLGGSIMIELFNNQGENFNGQWQIYWSLTCFAMCGIISITMIITCGQVLKNAILRNLYSLAAILARIVPLEVKNE